LNPPAQKVFTFAPSAEASRGVLRSDAGFANAETVEALLQNEKLQAQVRGQVIWIDEAGLLSVRTLARVADLAQKQNCRIILSGDTAQHRAVERGDALRHFGKARRSASGRTERNLAAKG
jgi:ATP-dependent exoDNAse (exonuclease V) alpha subunit